MPLTNEFEVIDDIKRVLGKPSKRVLLGIGDDAAVTKALRGRPVFTIDTMVEGVHFDLAYTTARQLGHKILAVNLSDLAAMGATPEYALVSLGLKQEVNEYFVTELYQGLKALAKRYKVDVIGGNLVQSPLTNVVDLVAVGSVKGSYFCRSGAKEGDIVAVTGWLGQSAAGLACLKRLSRQELADHEPRIGDCLTHHLTPQPRVGESLLLQKTGGVTAMIDISDGFAKELHHLSKASQVGFEIEEAQLPLSPATLAAAELLGAQFLPWALYGGEDYELLFTVKASSWKKVERAFRTKGLKLTRIGKAVSKRKGVRIHRQTGKSEPLEPRGWNHFVKRRPPSPLSL